MGATIEKVKKNNPVLHEKEGQLYQDAMKAMNEGPVYKSNEEALVAVNAQLARLAQKMGCSIQELLHQAETSREFKEEYLEARSLRGQLYCLKNSLK